MATRARRTHSRRLEYPGYPAEATEGRWRLASRDGTTAEAGVGLPGVLLFLIVPKCNSTGAGGVKRCFVEIFSEL